MSNGQYQIAKAKEHIESLCSIIEGMRNELALRSGELCIVRMNNLKLQERVEHLEAELAERAEREDL
jgi:hypothetical protein